KKKNEENELKIRCEVEFRQTILKNLSTEWLQGNSEIFLLKLNKLFISKIKTIVVTDLTENFIKTSLNLYKDWSLLISNQHLQNKSIFSSIKVISKDNNQEILLEQQELYPAFVSIYQKFFARISSVKRENLIQGKYSTLNFQLNELLDVIGWSDTVNYQTKMIKSLNGLESLKLLVVSKKVRTYETLVISHSFDKSTQSVRLTLNVKVFKSFLLHYVNIKEDFYKETIKSYQLNFEKNNKNRQPDYIFPLLTQSYNSLYSSVVYSGSLPNNCYSRANFSRMLSWLFTEEFVNKEYLKKSEITKFQTKTKVIYKFANGSFEVDLKRKEKKAPKLIES
ncbi:hypothetical protein, partial [Flavobacterium sp.]|uniref:hypothetical protein n=1 Tax=Flavobacterium sp. TaxID=239 RepID=UPI00374CF3C6